MTELPAALWAGRPSGSTPLPVWPEDWVAGRLRERGTILRNGFVKPAKRGERQAQVRARR